MNFKTIEEKMQYYRDLADHKLMPGTPVLIMIDGKNFSRKVKNKFKLPFDEEFMEAMNQTAKYVCENIQGIKLAYTQSDEISFFMSDYDNESTEGAFGYRMCKLQSIIPSMATSFFNRIMTARYIKENFSKEDNSFTYEQLILGAPLYEFDCKVWNVPKEENVFEWFGYRQRDCVRNSKQQAAQCHFSHKELMGKSTDEQIEMMKTKTGIDWHNYSNGEKFGRVIKRVPILLDNGVTRKKWKVDNASEFFTEEGKQWFSEIII